MTYSPIKAIRIKNFRNIGDMCIDFSQSPIVSLYGDNEAGKTSIIKAVAVCGLHANPKEQKEYIRTGTRGFGIAIELQDGTKVIRLKDNATNMYQVEEPGKEIWNTNKIDKEGLPVRVQEVMGMIQEPETKEFLHVRTYEDKLLFVWTGGGVNYKVLYDALKVDNLTRALRDGSLEANKLESDISRNESTARELRDRLRKVRVHDIEPAINIKNRLAKNVAILKELDKANELVKRQRALTNSLGLMQELSKINGNIDVGLAYKLDNYNRLKNYVFELKSKLLLYSKIEAIEQIETTLISKVEGLLGSVEKLNEIEDKSQLYKKIDSIGMIDSSCVSKLESLVNHIKSAKELSVKNNTYNFDGLSEIDSSMVQYITKLDRVKSLVSESLSKQTEFKELHDKATDIDKKIKQSGALVTECPNCGEAVVIDTNVLS